MLRSSALVLLALVTPAIGLAADFPSPVAGSLREAAALSRFLSLQQRDDAAAGDRFAVTGLNIAQESGQARLAVQQLQVTRAGKSTVIDGLQLTTPLVVDDAYLNNPAGGLFAALVKKGEIRIARIETSGKTADAPKQGVKDLLLMVSGGSFEGTLNYGSIRARATGSLAYDAQGRKLIVTLTGVSAGIPIGLDRVFASLSSALTFDWTVVKKPTITVVFDETFR